MNEHIRTVLNNLNNDLESYSLMLEAVDLSDQKSFDTILTSWSQAHIRMWSQASEDVCQAYKEVWTDTNDIVKEETHNLTPGALVYSYVVAMTAHFNSDVTDSQEFKLKFYDMLDKLAASN